MANPILLEHLPLITPAKLRKKIVHDKQGITRSPYQREQRIAKNYDATLVFSFPASFVVSREQFDALMEFYERTQGLDGFLFRDPLDHNLTAELTDTGLGLLSQGVIVQADSNKWLCKSYGYLVGDDFHCYHRPICYPNDDVEIWDGSGFVPLSVSIGTGQIIGAIDPDVGAVRGTFSIPVTFGEPLKWKPLTLTEGAYAEIQPFSLVEVKTSHAVDFYDFEREIEVPSDCLSITVGHRIPRGVDPFASDVVLLCHFDDALGSTTYLDSSTTPKTVANESGIVASRASISDEQSRFGGRSLKVTSPSGGTRRVNTSGLGFRGTFDLSIEFSFYPISTPSPNAGLLIEGSNNSTTGFQFGSDLKVLFFDEVELWRSPALPLNEWSQIAVVREGTALRCYINGALNSTTSLSPSKELGFVTLALGVIFGLELPFNGYIDEVRLTKAARGISFNSSPLPDP